jgi:hypothetical protein
MDEQQTNTGDVMADEMTLTLIKPVQLGGMQYTELQLSEPTAAELIKASKAGNPVEQLVTLIHLNAKVPRAVVDQLRQRDLDGAGDFFGRFSGASPQTLGTSSRSSRASLGGARARHLRSRGPSWRGGTRRRTACTTRTDQRRLIHGQPFRSFRRRH